MSAAFLGELPRLYHALAFVLIVGGIVVSSRAWRRRSAAAATPLARVRRPAGGSVAAGDPLTSLSNVPG